jgi:activator of HSP90 ATPase
MRKPTDTSAQLASLRRRQLLTGGSLAVGGLAWPGGPAWAVTAGEISRAAESIHQEPTFTATRQRVYEALTDTRQFDNVTQASGVMKELTQRPEPTRISPDEGGHFVLFGGYIVGRHIELVPHELIVQAWRVGNWNRGVYSLVRFELLDLSPGTRIVFDHTGFPPGSAEHLAAGWHAHYWDPLGKILAAG